MLSHQKCVLVSHFLILGPLNAKSKQGKKSMRAWKPIHHPEREEEGGMASMTHVQARECTLQGCQNRLVVDLLKKLPRKVSNLT